MNDEIQSNIMSSVTSRPASMASTSTIVHVHTQPPVKIMPAVQGPYTTAVQRDQGPYTSAVQRDPSMKRANSNHVVFHENPTTTTTTAYHTIIKVF